MTYEHLETLEGEGRVWRHGELLLEPARYLIHISRRVITTQTMNSGESRIPGRKRMEGRLFAPIPHSLMDGDIELELEDGRRWKCALSSDDGSLVNRGGLV